MSADNGIYILQTPNGSSPSGSEFRVAHLQAIDNVDWDHENNCATDDEDVHIKNARQRWSRSPVYTDKASALVEANRQAEEILNDDGVLEYGISTIRICREF